MFFAFAGDSTITSRRPPFAAAAFFAGAFLPLLGAAAAARAVSVSGTGLRGAVQGARPPRCRGRPECCRACQAVLRVCLTRRAGPAAAPLAVAVPAERRAGTRTPALDGSCPDARGWTAAPAVRHAGGVGGAPERERCPGCSVDLPRTSGPTHAYMTSSPSCWDAFGARLAADYADPARMAFHQVVVDAYAASHPGDGGRRQVQSVGLHLMTLCLVLEHGADPALGPALHRRMVGRPAFARLVPSGRPALTVLHVPTGGPVEDARRAALAWGRAVWDVYAHEHATVRGWLADAGLDAR